jgi:hypothetical protein
VTAENNARSGFAPVDFHRAPVRIENGSKTRGRN